MLNQKSRLAALGLAVSKVSHDLRNMLSSAQLLSDRLGAVDDPAVKRVAPKLIASIGRAIDLCEQTLKFGRVQEQPPRRERFAVRPLIEEAVEAAAVQASRNVVLYNEASAGRRSRCRPRPAVPDPDEPRAQWGAGGGGACCRARRGRGAVRIGLAARAA
jgi:signal transduction histidine kinase